jgi:hypothetical protein
MRNEFEEHESAHLCASVTALRSGLKPGCARGMGGTGGGGGGGGGGAGMGTGGMRDSAPHAKMPVELACSAQMYIMLGSVLPALARTQPTPSRAAHASHLAAARGERPRRGPARAGARAAAGRRPCATARRPASWPGAAAWAAARCC